MKNKNSGSPLGEGDKPVVDFDRNDKIKNSY